MDDVRTSPEPLRLNLRSQEMVDALKAVNEEKAHRDKVLREATRVAERIGWGVRIVDNQVIDTWGCYVSPGVGSGTLETATITALGRIELQVDDESVDPS